MDRKAIDLSGQIFGRLEVIGRLKIPTKNIRWVCKCDCGNIKYVFSGDLKEGNTQSCGCLHKEVMTKRDSVHQPTYNTWANMLYRTRMKDGSKNPDTYQYYFDVGVTDRWNTDTGGSYENFLEDMGERPPNTSLNRIGGAKIYSKETCEWADYFKQRIDQRVSKRNSSGMIGIRARKRKKGLMWLAEINIHKQNIRLYYGPSLDEAVRLRKEAELEYYGFNLDWEKREDE